MFMRKATALALAILMLANCATAPGEVSADQEEVPNWFWWFLGGTALAVTLFGQDQCCVSDERLKRDIKYVDTLPNGLKVYSFRYWNDDRTFVGVVAQNLLAYERFSHAVIENESGYYMVDLAALGLEIAGDREQYLEAGQKAVAEAKPVAN